MDFDLDLTKDRVFDKRVRTLRSVDISVKEHYSQPGFVYTGTGAEIEVKKKADEFCDGKTCDCCGAKLSPFSFNTLCDDCEERMRRDLFYKQFSTSVETPWFLTE